MSHAQLPPSGVTNKNNSANTSADEESQSNAAIRQHANSAATATATATAAPAAVGRSASSHALTPVQAQRRTSQHQQQQQALAQAQAQTHSAASSVVPPHPHSARHSRVHSASHAPFGEPWQPQASGAGVGQAAPSLRKASGASAAGVAAASAGAGVAAAGAASIAASSTQAQRLSGGPPTPSPPRSERTSPITVAPTAARETTQLQPQPQPQPPPAVPVLSYPQSYSFAPLTPPPQFAIVEPHLYRSGRFGEAHCPFLTGLHLRSIVYLDNPAEHAIGSHVRSWAAEQGVEIVNVGAAVFGAAAAAAGGSGGVASSSSSMSEWATSPYLTSSSSSTFLSLYSELVRGALEHVLSAAHAPCLLMCHNGVALCALVVGCLRRMQRWTYTSLLDEFTRSTIALQLREEVGRHGGGHMHKAGGPAASQSTGRGRGGPNVSLGGVGGGGGGGEIRYANCLPLSNDLQRNYRLEELMELFDLSLVKTPPLPQCVHWFRRQQADRRREKKAQRRCRQLRAAEQADQLTATASASVLAPTATALVSAAQGEAGADVEIAPIVAPGADGGTVAVAVGVASPPSPPLRSWSLDLLSTFRSNRLVSRAVRYDKKMSLVDEDED